MGSCKVQLQGLRRIAVISCLSWTAALVGCTDDSGDEAGSVADGGGHGHTHADAAAHTDGATHPDDGEDAGADFCTSDAALSLDACDPSKTTFSLTIDNPFYPLVVGQISAFEGEEDGAKLKLEIEVLDETEVVGGVTTRIIEEREEEDGEIVEISRNYFAQAEDGTVCYFGEEVDIYEGGKVVSHDGAWRAEKGNRAGIVMPPTPKLGDFFAQEEAPDVALDRAEVSAVGEKYTVGAGTFTDTLQTRECSPLEPGHYSIKRYARGVGLIADNAVLLQSH